MRMGVCYAGIHASARQKPTFSGVSLCVCVLLVTATKYLVEVELLLSVKHTPERNLISRKWRQEHIIGEGG